MSWPTGFTDKELDDLEQDLRDAYAQAWVGVRDEMKKSYQKYYDEYKKQEKLYKNKEITKEQLTDWKKAHLGIAERWDKMTDNIASKLYGVNKLATEYVNDTTPTVYAMNANYQAYLIEQAVPTVQLDNGVTLGVAFDLVDEAAVKAAIFDPESPMYGKLHTEFRVYSVNPIRDYQWNTQKIKSALTAGILAGDSVADMTNRFMGIMQNNRTAAIRNARTSITSAHNAGREHAFETAQEMGIKIKKQWVATLDSRTRDSHQDMDGEIREIGERYSNGLMYPGDPDGAPEEVYNCRCSEIGVIDGTQVASGRRIARDENGKNVYLNNFTFKGSATSNNYAEWLEQKINFNRDGKNRTIADAVNSGEISTQINTQKQKKHMETTREANRSYFTISESELQKIVNEKYGTGFLKSTTPIKEVIVLDKTVGVVYNNLGEYMGETNRMTIHYSKRKTHAVPSKRREYGKTKLA